MDDLAYIVTALAPSHALHGAFREIPAESGKRAMCSCGVDVTFSAMQIATLLIFDDKKPATTKKEKVTDGA